MPRLSTIMTQESDGSSDAGKLPALDESGKLDKSFLRPDDLRELVTGSAVTVTGPDTELVDVNSLILVNPAAGAVTLSLPASHTSGDTVLVKMTSAATYSVTLDPNGSQTIDGETTFVMYDDYEWIALVSDGTNWFQVG